MAVEDVVEEGAAGDMRLVGAHYIGKVRLAIL